METKTHILIVEDERITAEDIRARIEDLDYSVCGIARSGNEAVEKARTLNPDIVIMDIILSGDMTGIEAACQIYNELDIPVIYLTAHSDQKTISEASQTEAFGYLLKPVRDDDLQTTLEIAIHKHESEKKLRASEENYRVLVEALGQYILKVDPDAQVLFANQAALEWLQIHKQDLEGKEISTVIEPQISDRLLPLIQQVIQEKDSFGEEIKTESDGKVLYYNVVLYPICEKTDHISAVLVIIRDITREREIQRLLETAEERFEKLYHEMPVGIYQSTPEGQIRKANDALMTMLGYESMEELECHTAQEEYLNGADRDKFLDIMTKEGAITGYEVQWKRHDGKSIWIHETARAYRDSEGHTLFFEGIVEDITERKEAELEIQHRLNFEEVISSIASKFVQTSNLEETINQSLQSLGQLSGADRVYFGAFQEETLQVERLQYWCKKGVKSQRDRYLSLSFSDYPWWKERLHLREVVNIGALEDMPKKAQKERTCLKNLGVKSQLLMPVFCGIHLFGFIGFDNVEQTITWRMVDITLIQIFSDILSSGLERKSMFESLRISEDKFRGIFNSSAIGIALSDMDGQIVEANQAFFDLLGIADLDALHQNTFLKDLCKHKFAKQGDSGSDSITCEEVFDFVQLHEEGNYTGSLRETRHVNGVITPLILSAENQLSGLLIQIQDVTDRIKATEAVKCERDLMQALIENIPDTIYFKDRRSSFTRINPAQAKLLGVSDPQEAIGKTDFDYFTPQHAKTAFEDEQELIRGKRSIVTKLEEIKRDDGSVKWLTSSKVPLKNQDNEIIGIMGISRDVTDIKRAEEKLLKAADALQKSNKELMQFAYVASHDLQEPLRTIASYIQLLQNRYKGKLDENADTFMNYAVDGVSRMQQLIKDLLLYSRVDTQGKPFETTNLNEVLDMVQMNLKFAIEDNAVQIKIDPLPTIQADGSQLIQLFQNLISNAIKFKGTSKPVIHIQSELIKHLWHIRVKDNGIGIPADQLENIFIIFKRLHTRQDYEGTGIGLAVCKKIVERHGGSIQVTSREGEGSVFTITFPEQDNSFT